MNYFNKKIIAGIVACTTVLGAGAYGYIVYNNPQRLMDKYIVNEDYEKVVSVYNDKILDSEYEEFYNNKINHIISDIMVGYEQDNNTYDEAISQLTYFTSIRKTKIMNLCKDNIDYINIEYNGDVLYKKALEANTNQDYITTIQSINQINTTYSDYHLVEELLQKCISDIIVYTHDADSEEQFKAQLELLDACYSYIHSDALLQQRKFVEDKMNVFINVQEILENAKALYSNEKYKDAFKVLEEGLIQYSDNRNLTASLTHYHELYVTYISNKCKTLIENKEYKEAYSIVNEANVNHPCDEFEELLMTIKHKQNPLHPITDFINDLLN